MNKEREKDFPRSFIVIVTVSINCFDWVDFYQSAYALQLRSDVQYEARR